MKKYSSDPNALMLISLMKAHGFRKVIASPGTTNIAIVGSIQHDDFFEMYSCVDERSAAYMACGLSAESGEPVAVICTGATASRNYLPALTEAYYRKLPVLVIAGSHGEYNIGHLHSQVIDRSQSPKDTFKYSAFINPIDSNNIKWLNNVEINKAFIKLKQHGGGPVLINIVASASKSFDSDDLPAERVIHYHSFSDIINYPKLPEGRIAIFIGSHTQMFPDLQKSIDDFCESNDAVVFCDHTSGYQGRYRVNFALVNSQQNYETDLNRPDLLIHLGEVSGDTYTTKKLKPHKVWRVNNDGEVRDLFKTLSDVFETDELSFFRHYVGANNAGYSYYNKCINEYDKIYDLIPEMEFGNIYVAKALSSRMPKNSVIHFGIFNSLRTWNFFRLDDSIECSCNVGGFGIDGACSTLIGASWAYPNKIHFLIVGDLAFFYDINSLGNRHISNNVRIILVNNGRGIEFRKKDHPGYRFGEEADYFMAAGGHFGCQSKELVRKYSENLGFEYMSASSKNELELVIGRFLSSELLDKPLILEVFPKVNDEVENLDKIRNIKSKGKPLAIRLRDSATDDLRKIAKKGLSKLGI